MQYVKSIGPTDAKIVVVGEAPGAEEELRGIPFCGNAGHELEEEMLAAGLFKRSTFITNVCKYRPPNNELGEWIRPATRKAPPEGFVEHRGRFVRPFIVGHLWELERELQLVRPNVVVALGNAALWALTDKTGISKWRGSLLRCTLPGCEGMKVIPLYHPAYILRDYQARWETIEDWRKVKAESETPELSEREWDFIIRPSVDMVLDRLHRLILRAERAAGAGEVVELTCDIETRQRQIACLGLGVSPTQAMCIPFMCLERADGYFTLDEEVEVVHTLRRLLTHPAVRVINQNFLYDAYYLAMLWGMVVIPSFDTMIAQHVCFPGKEKSLAFIASLYCKNYIYWKDDGKEWNAKLDEDQLWRYNCMDCCYTWEAAQELKKVIAFFKLEEQFSFLMSQFHPVLMMMLRGVRSDPVLRDKYSQELLTMLQEHERTVEGIVGYPLNVASPTQLKHFLYDEMGIPPIVSRKTHSPSTDTEALERIRYKEPLVAKVCDLTLACRTIRIFRSTFIDAKGPRDRYLTAYNIAGTVTFRYSSSSNPMGWGTNLQNVPKKEEDDPKQPLLPDVRTLFLPDEGYVLLDYDLSKADLHVVVWESEEEELKEMLRRGVNIYKEVGTKYTGMPYKKAKSFLHGTNYCGTPRTMAINTGISTAQAQAAQRRWFSAYPGIKRWHGRIAEELQKWRTASNRFGFRRIFFERVDGILPEAAAWGPQSTVAIIISKALCGVWKRWGLNNGLDLLLQVHDELLLQVKEAYVEEAVREVDSIFSSIIVPYPDPLIIPHERKVGRPGQSWGELKG
jgi:uracil-DNA glycosylase family 4